jgi:thioredoxin-like negative regulator of GroEL
LVLDSSSSSDFNFGCGANGCSIPNTQTTITMSNFDTIIQLKPVLIDFFSTWCGPAKMLGTDLKK